MKGGSEIGGFPPLSFVGPGKEEEGAVGPDRIMGGRSPSKRFGSDNSNSVLYENLPLRRKRYVNTEEDEEENAYDVLPSRKSSIPALPPGGLLPTAARLLLMASPQAAADRDDGIGEDEDTQRPSIPSPDYGSDGGGSEDSNSGEAEEGDYEEGDYSVHDQGLEVILEESEEEKGSGDGSNEQKPYVMATAPLHNYGALLSDFGKKSQPSKGVVVQHLTNLPNGNDRNHFEEPKIKNKVWLDNSVLYNSMGRDLSKVDDKKEDDVKNTPNGNHVSVRGLRNRFEAPTNIIRINSSSPVSAVPQARECMSNGKRSADVSPITERPQLNKESINENSTDVGVKPTVIKIKDNSDEYIVRLRKCTLHWNPGSLMDKLYSLKQTSEATFNSTRYTNISGTLDKLPSGRRKATFWNAWKSRYFKAENGYLYIYQKASSENPLTIIQLMGGKIEVLKPIGMDENQLKNCTLLGIDDGKGHYVVVKCPNEIEANAWHTALSTQVAENYESTYVQPINPISNPSITKDTIIIDLGSCSLRAGILSTQPSLPQIFFPSVMAIHKETNDRCYGFDAVQPDIRSESRIYFPIRPSAKITKYSVDLEGLYGLIEKVLKMLAVQPDGYNIFLSVPRSFNASTLSNIANTMFEKWKIKSLSICHQSVLTLYAYNARSGIVVDIGERTDVIPISEGYILERGVSRTPYGSHQVVEKLRQLLNEKNHSFATDVESYLIRYIVENLCYCAQDYATEVKEAVNDLDRVKKEISIKDVYCDSNLMQDSISLDVGRFQAPEGLFTPETWGHDNIGVHKMVHKGIQECSLDIRKEMIRNIYLSGGVTMLPGFSGRLLKEIDKLTPPTITPMVHASPYRYHAAYIGATVLANSEQVTELTVKRQEWLKSGTEVLRKWNI